MQFLQGKSATEFGHTLGTLLTGAKQVVVAGDARRAISKCSTSACARGCRAASWSDRWFDLDLRRSIVTKRAEQATARFAGVHFPPR
jgi:chromosomal replication initiator protein